MSDVFPFTSRWGSSVQHSHREHPGCRKTRGGVFQDEKCKDSTSQPLWNLSSFWVFGPKLLLQVQYIDCSLTSCPFLPLFQMFQVIQPERALYIQANNCVEARDWIDILTKVSQCNRKRLSTYHPSAYLNGHWLCCKLSADTAPGCTPCTGYVTFFQHVSSIMYLSLFVDSLILPYASVFSGLPANIQLDVDGDRETERIYSLFSTYMTKLIKMQGQTLARCMCMILSFLCLRSPSPPHMSRPLTLLPVSPCRGLWQ